MRVSKKASSGLLTASFNGDLQEVLNCIAAGADVNCQHSLVERTPLFYAAEHGSVEIVEALLATRRVDHELWDYKDETPLDRAKKLRDHAQNERKRHCYDRIVKLISAYDVPSPSMAPGC